VAGCVLSEFALATNNLILGVNGYNYSQTVSVYNACDYVMCFVAFSIIGLLIGTCVAFYIIIGDIAPVIISNLLGVEVSVSTVQVVCDVLNLKTERLIDGR
jgi:hypothetical protein